MVDHHLARARAVADRPGPRRAAPRSLPVLGGPARTLERIYVDRAVGRSRSRSPPARPRLPRRAPGPRGDARQPARQRLQMGARTRSGSRRCARPAASWSRSTTTARACRDERRAVVLERGPRLDEQVPGSGLGLAIVRRHRPPLWRPARPRYRPRGRPARAPRSARRTRGLTGPRPPAEPQLNDRFRPGTPPKD